MPPNTFLTRFSLGVDELPLGADIALMVYQDGRRIGVSTGSATGRGVTLTTGGTFDVYLVQRGCPGTASSRTSP
ncbi:hypothetical protein [Jidongwangia harbinensis]|uniref:hypothetical protein n=1 Tax=Jidongwangia harbinensis TaxID=2878561 RepID=UPI001CDA048C|nr:hypothetical protein [Jidongwangia harbinensis]MCA2217476.1 hypothetical protein [Jidongwangia harbinensis]